MEWFYVIVITLFTPCLCAACCACWFCYKALRCCGHGYTTLKNYSQRHYDDVEDLNQDVLRENAMKATMAKMKKASEKIDSNDLADDSTESEDNVVIAVLIPDHTFALEPAKIGKMSILRQQAKSFISRYELGKRLNAGAEGVTFLAKDLGSGRTVVVKQPHQVTNIADFEELKNKHHPNIVRVFELFHNAVETYVVMECCAGGDLFKALEHLGNPTQNWCAAVAAQAFRGVAYLHEQFQQSHNDIKPENILLDHEPLNSSDVPRVMIGDFGCARSSGSASINTDPTVGGDPRYRAPETWKGAPFGIQSDVWSLGVTLFELLSGGQLIYIYQRNISGWSGFCAASEGKLYQKFIGPAQRGEPVKVKTIDGDAARSLLTGLLAVKPEKRFTMEQALKHQWFELANSTTTVSFGPKAAQLLRARAKCSKLRVGLLNLVGSMLQGESLKYYNEIWSQYDAGGVMTLSQFEDMFNGSGLSDGAPYAGVSGPSAQDVFNMADGDGDGQISFDEFVAIMFNPDELDEAQRIEYLKAAFKILANDNDEITVEAMRGLFVDQNIEVLTELFQDIDADGSGVVDYDEFAAYVEEI